MLEDRLLHNIVNLKVTKNYSFLASQNDIADRFVVHFGPQTNITEKIDLPARIYRNDSQIIVDMSLVSKKTTFILTDLTGRKLMSIDLTGETVHYIDISSNTGILLINLRNVDGTLVRKMTWIRN